MKPVWIAFFVGLFIGANFALVILAMLFSSKSCDHNFPNIEDVQAEQ